MVLTCNSTTCLAVNSLIGTPLRLQPATTSWDIWIPFTEELLPHYITARSHRINIPRESPSIFSCSYNFSIYYCQLEPVTMTCDYDIFTGKNRHRDVEPVLLPGPFCLQIALTHTVPIGRHNNTLTRVTDNHWKISVDPSYDCTFTMTIVKTYHNLYVRT